MGVPWPTPGSRVPKKYSAAVTLNGREVTDPALKKMVFLKVGPQALEPSRRRTLMRVGEAIPAVDAAVFKTASRASSKAPSKASMGVPWPAPGSRVPKKYSAAVMLNGREVTEPALKKMVFLKVGPQALEPSRRRTLTRVGEAIPAVDAAVLSTASRASSKAPSNASMGVPWPAPGSRVPKKYSAAVTLNGRVVTEPALKKMVFLNVGPQTLEPSRRRTLIRVGEFSPAVDNAP